MPKLLSMNYIRFCCFVGLGGVCDDENNHARRVGLTFSYLIIAVSIGLLLQWQVEMVGGASAWFNMPFNWGMWLFFLIEYSWLLSVVDDKRRYVRCNWLLPLVLVAGIPLLFNHYGAVALFHIVRPFFAIFLLLPSLRQVGRFFIDGQLWTTLVAVLIFVIVFGILVAGIDPSIHSVGDGIWWAMVTVSTIGYGDVVPTSMLGRMLGGCLLVLGLGMFVVLTANFLALMLRKEKELVKKEEQNLEQMQADIHMLRLEQAALMGKIDRLLQSEQGVLERGR